MFCFCFVSLLIRLWRRTTKNITLVSLIYMALKYFRYGNANTRGLSRSDLGEFFCNLQGKKFKQEKNHRSYSQNKSKKIPTQLPGHCDLTGNVSLNKHEVLKKLQTKSLIFKERSEIPQNVYKVSNPSITDSVSLKLIASIRSKNYCI